MSSNDMQAVGETRKDDPSHAWTASDRHFSVTNWPPIPGQPAPRFIKRQLKAHERQKYKDGSPALGKFNLDRLENEKETLKFIAQNTSIPVPRVLDWSVDEHGIASLTMEVVEGRMMDDLLRGDRLTDEEKTTLKSNVDSFMHDVVLPQLSKLRSNSIGQLTGVLFLPPRIRPYGTDHPNGVRAGPAKYTATVCSTFCHNDLAAQNVVIEPDSLEVKCLIDWEYAGFFPPGFEMDYWRYTFDDYVGWDNDPDQLMMASRRALLEEAGTLNPYQFRSRILTTAECRASYGLPPAVQFAPSPRPLSESYPSPISLKVAANHVQPSEPRSTSPRTHTSSDVRLDHDGNGASEGEDLALVSAMTVSVEQVPELGFRVVMDGKGKSGAGLVMLNLAPTSTGRIMA